MSDAFIKEVRDYFENYDSLVCIDRFHVSQLFNKALNKVRRAEYNEIERKSRKVARKKRKKNPLSKMRAQFLKNSKRTDNRDSKRRPFLQVSRLHLKTSRAWKIKETASTLWEYSYAGVAEKNWKKLLRWISLCRIPEIIKVGKTLRKYFFGILNAIRLKQNNGILEATNSVIQRIKKVACGFRNKQRFSTSVMFHLGKLDMMLATC